MLSPLALLTLLATSASPVLANAPPPDDLRERPKPIAVQATSVPLQVKKHRGPTRIKIPAAVLAKLQADNSKTGAVIPINRTLFAGLSLALAAGCAFVVFGRRVRHPRAMATAAVLLVAGLFFITDASADLLPGKPLGPAKAKPSENQVVVEVIQNGKAIELWIGKDADWAK